MEDVFLSEVLEKTLDKIGRNVDAVGFKYPHVSLSGKYNDQGPEFWTSGFWAGLLWLYYSQRKDPKAKELAIKLEEGQDKVLDGFYTIHHDVGFMWIPTAYAHYKDDGCAESRLRALKAASHLAGRYNLKGHFIRAWNDGENNKRCGWAIIDCMMNLSLLYWASRETGDPRFKHIAMSHTDMVLTSFRRDDGSYPHVVSFDPETGEKIENIGGQGYGPDSAWARGQAWAIYGMSIAYRETGDVKYLDAAKNAANFFLAHLPEDKVPVWDFRAPEGKRDATDSSASAIVASALAGIAAMLPEGVEKDFYRNNSIAIIKGLYDNYADFSDKEDAIITKGTVHYPAGKNINVPIIYADYFFLEALLKLKGCEGLF